MVLTTIVTGAYKPTYNWGASHWKSHPSCFPPFPLEPKDFDHQCDIGSFGDSFPNPKHNSSKVIDSTFVQKPHSVVGKCCLDHMSVIIPKRTATSQ